MAKLNLKPLDDRVIIEQSEAEEKTTGGIVLPDAAKEKPTRGTVLATGPGKLLDSGKRAAMAVKTGDTVIYGKYSGTEVDLGGKKYHVLHEKDILGVIESA